MARDLTAYSLRTTPEGLSTAKLVLRILSLAFCAILIGLGSKLGQVPGAVIIIAIPSVATLVWDLGLVVASLFRRGRDIHAGTRVGVDVIVWLCFGALTILMTVMWSIWGPSMGAAEFDVLAFRLVKATVFLSAVQTFLRIALFIVACHELRVHKQNKALMRKALSGEPIE